MADEAQGLYSNLEFNDGGVSRPVLVSILFALEHCGPAAASALPALQKLAEKDGPYQERAQNLINRFQPKLPLKPAEYDPVGQAAER